MDKGSAAQALAYGRRKNGLLGFIGTGKRHGKHLRVDDSRRVAVVGDRRIDDGAHKVFPGDTHWALDEEDDRFAVRQKGDRTYGGARLHFAVSGTLYRIGGYGGRGQYRGCIRGHLNRRPRSGILDVGCCILRNDDQLLREYSGHLLSPEKSSRRVVRRCDVLSAGRFGRLRQNRRLPQDLQGGRQNAGGDLRDLRCAGFLRNRQHGTGQ